MTAKSINIIAAINAIAATFDRKLVIVETGTIRNTAPEFEEGDGHSTKAIAEWIKEHGGLFYSIDTDIKIAAKYLFECDLRTCVQLKEGLSTDILPTIDSIDFAYLDSANDAQNTMDEFNIVWPKIVTGGGMMVDDCNIESAELFKGDMLMPWLDEREIAYLRLETNQIIIWK